VKLKRATFVARDEDETPRRVSQNPAGRLLLLRPEVSRFSSHQDGDIEGRD
jgi:hypothetical protein